MLAMLGLSTSLSLQLEPLGNDLMVAGLLLGLVSIWFLWHQLSFQLLQLNRQQQGVLNKREGIA
jgi:hypothetical protein